METAAMESWVMESLGRHEECIRLLKNDTALISSICAVAGEVIECYRNSGKTIWLGNGGSASQAEHLAGELGGRFLADRKPLPSLTPYSTASLTAIANDYGYADVFARFVEGNAKAGDVVLGLSTSGNSENVLRALDKAGGLGAVTAGGGLLGHLVQPTGSPPVERIGIEPVGEGLGTVEGEDGPAARLGVEQVAEAGHLARADVDERKGPHRSLEVGRKSRGVLLCLWLHAGQAVSIGLRLQHTARLAIDEEQVVDVTVAAGQRELADSDAAAGIEVEIGTVLDDPAGFRERGVDLVPGTPFRARSAPWYHGASSRRFRSLIVSTTL